MTEPTSGPQPATNWYGTRRHYSTNLLSTPGGGHVGRSLCTTANNPVDVWDQDAMDVVAQQYRSKRVTIADLPECKKCTRIMAREGASSCP